MNARSKQPPLDSPSLQAPSRVASSLARWFNKSARDLPWRTTPRDPYRSFVSEIMLQQTQVSRVVERFESFIARFPTLVDLAAADEQSVLAEWSGMGYYRRARNLHKAAQQIVHDFDAQIPRDVEALSQLVGVGPYTAGAIASIVFNRPAPIVDGNVRRVLMRLTADQRSPDTPDVQRAVWDNARALAHAARNPAATNEGLMELGATICSRHAPSCPICPLQIQCKAHAQGLQGSIPSAKPARPRQRVFHCAVLVRDSRGRVLVECRPGAGLWSGMWQAPALERNDRPSAPRALREAVGVTTLRKATQFDHQTTHRQVQFCVWTGRLAPGKRPKRGHFVTQQEALALPLATPHRRILTPSQ